MARKTSYRKESDAGDVAKKIMHGINETYKVGGVGLVIIAIGAVCFLFLILLHSVLDNLLSIIILLISIVLMGAGVWILLKEEGKKMNEFSGKVKVKTKDGEKVIGVNVKKLTKFKPGTEIEVDTENVKETTGLKIDNQK